ncbi:hypothetical protein D3C84_923480 [compost metagenome]
MLPAGMASKCDPLSRSCMASIEVSMNAKEISGWVLNTIILLLSTLGYIPRVLVVLPSLIENFLFPVKVG